MPHSIPPGLTRDHVLKTLSELDGGMDHPFGKATGYELIHHDKGYAPKAVVGLACRYFLGRILMPDEFSGGEAPGQANFVLRKLGFNVISKGNADTDDEEKRSNVDWTQEEVGLLVADYFEMLDAELHGKPYKKSAYRKALLPKLHSRSDGVIEFKHQNVSGVLVELGLPYIEGYKPRSNYQGMLATEVENFIESNEGLVDRLANALAFDSHAPRQISDIDLEQVIEDPPERIITPARTSKPWLSRKHRKIDFAERDAKNRKLGHLGEQFVFELERHRLKTAGRDDLAKRVMWASQEIGDGLGFDILSFDAGDESEQMLEVKTTGLGKFFPFYVTGNEVRCSEDVAQRYQLCRVFDFGRDPRLYILHGSLRELCQLEPVLFRAAF